MSRKECNKCFNRVWIFQRKISGGHAAGKGGRAHRFLQLLYFISLYLQSKEFKEAEAVNV
jgi:hypothetical protein